MNLSELIDRLVEIQDDYGDDIEVNCITEDGVASEVDNVEVESNHNFFNPKLSKWEVNINCSK